MSWYLTFPLYLYFLKMSNTLLLMSWETLLSHIRPKNITLHPHIIVHCSLFNVNTNNRSDISKIKSIHFCNRQHIWNYHISHKMCKLCCILYVQLKKFVTLKTVVWIPTIDSDRHLGSMKCCDGISSSSNQPEYVQR